MSKPTGISHSTLSWVKKELDETLRQAAEALEAYSQDSSDPTNLQFCGSHLHQVHGILQMLELFGAAMLVEEMEQVVEALLARRAEQPGDAQQALMQSILQLGDYLERVQSGLQDIPILLLPLLNDLRAARGENLLTENSLFAPNLDAAQVRPDRPRATGQDLSEVAKQQRSRYQRGLLGLLRERNVPASLNQMLDALGQLEAATRDDAAGNIWWIAGGVLEALQHNSIEAAAAVKMLLGQVDRQIRRAVDGGEVGLAVDPPRDLIKNLLYYVARAEPHGERIPLIQAQYRLKDLLLDQSQLDVARQGMAGPNTDILQTVATALKEDLAAAKDGLDLFARSGYADRDRLAPLGDGLRRVADTLGVIGLGVPRNVIKEQAARIQAMADGAEPDEGQLMEIAEALLYVESAIDGLGAGGRSEQPDAEAEAEVDEHQQSVRHLSEIEYQQVYGTAVGEVIADVARIKESIVKFIESGNPDDTSDLARRFAELVGAMKLLGKSHVADLLEAAGRYVADRLTAGALPASHDLDSLADAIASIEYYLEAARDGYPHPESVLEVADAALTKLGFVPGQSQSDPVVDPEAEKVEPSTDTGFEFSLELDDSGIEEISLDAVDVPAEPDAADAGFDLEWTTEPAPGLEQLEPAADTSVEEPERQPAPVAAAPVADAVAKKSRINYDVPVMGDAVDEDILEIFIEEAGEVLETLREQYPRWRDDPDNTDALTTLRRMYHTLKGSGRLAGALLLGELAWSIENLLNRVLDRSIQATPAVHSIVEQSMQVLPALIGQIQGDPAPDVDVFAIMRQAEALADPDHPGGPGGGLARDGADSEPSVAESGETASSSDGSPGFELSLDEPSASGTSEEIVLESSPFDDAPQFEVEQIEAAGLPDDAEAISLDSVDLGSGSQDEPGESVAADAAPAMDPVLYDIFSRETADHLSVVSDFVAHGRDMGDHGQPNEALVRALHTLTGSARMADVDPIARVGRRLEVLAERHLTAEQAFDATGLDLLERGAALIDQMVAGLASPSPQWPDIEPLLAEISDASAALEGVEPARSGRGLEALALEAIAEQQAGHVDDTDADRASAQETQAEPDAVTEADLVPAQPTESASQQDAPDSPAVATDLDLDLVALFIEEAGDILEFLESTVQRWEDEPDHAGTVAELHRSLHTLKGGARLAGFNGIGTLCHVLESVTAEVAEHKVPADDVFFNVLHACLDRLTGMVEEARQGGMPDTPQDLLQAIADLHGTSPSIADVAVDQSADADSELVEVFLEEAADILEATESALNRWHADPDDMQLVNELQRALHTLKGGARMAGFRAIGDLSHAFETLLVAVQGGSPAVSDQLFDVLERVYDRLYSMRDKAAAGQALDPATDLLDAIEALRTGGAPPPEPKPIPAAATEPAQSPAAELPEPTEQADPVQVAPTATRTPAKPAPAAEEPPRAVRDDAAQSEAIRVRADLLDNLVNFAGEVSIYRARLEQQLGAMRFNLGELDQTVARLREQLRTLEIETEAQILYRFDRDYDTGGAERADFDPLELDRFSRMQELSRALAESSNDLVSIQSLLDNLTRESETLLLQQSRINTELQDGLMRTRMVPFANLVPRMRRIIRQTCHELGKRAQLKVLGAQGEMDRTVLERVTASLEHMLRNAVAHGVEDPEVRVAAGKPAEGTITVALSREGADVVIRVSDDGGGINLDAIRRKAIDKGLMPADAPLSDREIMQFILEAGFSTAEQVTQIAGRGVGMDVVASEIKQLGGTLEIDSNADAGTTFTVRLPFTLAVNQALLCQAGEDVYAIPLTSIEGVVRMTHEELEHCYANPHAAYYEYAGERYEVRGLTTLLAMADPVLPGPGKRAPIILVHTGDHRVAIQVDSLLGNREIVVKSVGAQISTVPGIYGATILADGRVVLILDVASLVRLGLTQHLLLEPEEPAASEAAVDVNRKVTIMVVDDSITMRKVATRLLERNGMAVITAKDGVDAVARLQEHIPDAMLLDIEMPRMDGYELATHMRNDPRLQQVPIIMITSRTGEKHRQRAMEIGVNRYLGKPYQEAELLENVREVLEEARVHG